MACIGVALKVIKNLFTPSAQWMFLKRFSMCFKEFWKVVQSKIWVLWVLCWWDVRVMYVYLYHNGGVYNMIVWTWWCHSSVCCESLCDLHAIRLLESLEMNTCACEWCYVKLVSVMVILFNLSKICWCDVRVMYVYLYHKDGSRLQRSSMSCCINDGSLRVSTCCSNACIRVAVMLMFVWPKAQFNIRPSGLLGHQNYFEVQTLRMCFVVCALCVRCVCFQIWW